MSNRRLDPSRHPRLNLVGQNELAVIDRWVLEERARAIVQPVYLGQSTALCRVLGRYKMYIDTTDVGFGAHVLLDGFWESWLTAFIARRVEPGARVVDVGANHGYYTLLMADLAGPEGKVLAVEPNPHVCALLRRSVDLNGFGERTRVLEQAAGAAESEEVSLYLPPRESKNARVLGPAETSLVPAETLVRVRSGPLAAALADWDRIDFIKVDVEGAEEAAIAGLAPMLEAHRPRMILEFNAARCSTPLKLLTDLAAIYGRIEWLDFDGELHAAEPETLLDPAHVEDWLLYLSPGS